MKTYSVHSLLFCAFIILAGCKKNGGGNPPVVTSPSVSGISPASGPKNTAVTISGNNFGTDATKVTVSFNGLAATVQSVTNTTIVALVPAKANTGIVKVTVNAQAVDGPIFNYTASYTVTTVAGNGSRGYVDGIAASAQFDFLVSLAIDANGNIFVADENNCIRKITAGINPVVSTFAGNPLDKSGIFNDGNGNTATFFLPSGLIIDAQGNFIESDISLSSIRKITAASFVTTLSTHLPGGYVDGALATAQFNGPASLAQDAQGNIYVTDFNNTCIRKISAGLVSTLAGSVTPGNTDGTGTAASFRSPFGLAIDAQGNIFVTDVANNSVRKITPTGIVSTYCGGTGHTGHADGDISVARFAAPRAIAIDTQGNLYVTDRSPNSANLITDYVRKITPAGMVSTIAGSDVGYADGDGLTAKFNGLNGITVDAPGNIYVSDALNYRIRKITLE
jgi:sugar lactone lactonase YvrE